MANKLGVSDSMLFDDLVVDINISDEFINDIKQDKYLYMFWLSFSYSSNSKINLRYPIKTEPLFRYNYLIDLSSTGISSAQYLNLYSYTNLIFYYAESKISTPKVAFELTVKSDNSDNSNNVVSLYDYARNLLLIDLSKYNPRFKLIQTYSYTNTSDSSISYGIPVPTTQHYHGLLDDLSDSLNAVNSSVIISSSFRYSNFNGLPDYITPRNHIKNNKLVLGGSELNLISGNPDGKFINNSNKIYIFDNGNYFPLVTLYNSKIENITYDDTDIALKYDGDQIDLSESFILLVDN